MKTRILAVLAIAAAMSGNAFAQTLVIEPQQETVIREYVTAQKVEPVQLADVEIAVGTVLPETVELHTLEVPDVSYSYVVVDDRTVLVEPDTRKIVHIIN